MNTPHPHPPPSDDSQTEPDHHSPPDLRAPLPNYTLSAVCPACGAPMVRRACKVRCDRCGFMWDCSEL